MFAQEKKMAIVSAIEAATGHRVNVSTGIRWCIKPRLGVKLESIVLGGRRLTSVEAVMRYVEAMTTAANKEEVVPETPSPRKTRSEAEQSAKKLAKRLESSKKARCA